MMTAEEYLKGGRLDEALASLQEDIRGHPAEAPKRIFLFQLLVILGKWERALTQLQVLAEMDAESQLLAHLFRSVIQCEVLRGEVFAGRRTPIIFGEPQEWIGWLIQANQLAADGQYAAASTLRDQAFEAAPATPGKLDDQAFEWIADADPRLGPMLEAIVEGRYYWVPFFRLLRVDVEKPGNLRDFVWCPARFKWANGGEAAGYIPTRYAGTEEATDHGLRLARKTDWVPKSDGYFFGVGQRVLTTDHSEMALLETRRIEIEPTPSAG